MTAIGPDLDHCIAEVRSTTLFNNRSGILLRCECDFQIVSETYPESLKEWNAHVKQATEGPDPSAVFGKLEELYAESIREEIRTAEKAWRRSHFSAQVVHLLHFLGGILVVIGVATAILAGVVAGLAALFGMYDVVPIFMLSLPVGMSVGWFIQLWWRYYYGER